METIPIASLEGLSDSAHKQLQGVITLVWPYSSLTCSAAFLLAESDFRLRYKKGQVRVQLRGAVAVAFAQARLSIGDVVTLQLDGARWAAVEEGIVSTPGRSVDLELVYAAKLDLTVQREGSQAREIHIDEPERVVESSAGKTMSSMLITPRPITPIPRRLIQESAKVTPVFHQSARLSGGSAVDSLLDPFGDEDIGNDHQRKKPRISWGTPNRWKVVGQTPSPQKTAQKREEDVFWLNSQSSKTSSSEQTPPASSANSGTTIPIDEAVMTQIVEEARQSDRDRLQATQQESKRDNQASKFEMYRDPPSLVEPYIPQAEIAGRQNVPMRSSPFTTPLADKMVIQNFTTSLPTNESKPDVIEILSDSDPGSSDQDEDESVIEVVDSTMREPSIPPQRGPSMIVSLDSIQQEDVVASLNADTAQQQSSEPSQMPKDNLTILTTSRSEEPPVSSRPSPQPEGFLRPRTPEIQPLVSPSRPLPSPFPHEHISNIFAFDSAQPKADAVPSIPTPWALAAPSEITVVERHPQPSANKDSSGISASDSEPAKQADAQHLPTQSNDSQSIVDKQISSSSAADSQPTTSSNEILDAISHHQNQTDHILAREDSSFMDRHLQSASFEELMTHVSDSQHGTEQHLSFEHMLLPSSEDQGQPTGSFASADLPNDLGNFNFATSAFLHDATGVSTAGAGATVTPANLDHYKDEIDAILGQVPSHATDSRFGSVNNAISKPSSEHAASPNSAIKASAMSSFADLLQATISGAENSDTRVTGRIDDGFQSLINLEPAEHAQTGLTLSTINNEGNSVDIAPAEDVVTQEPAPMVRGGGVYHQQQPYQIASFPPIAEASKSAQSTPPSSSKVLYPVSPQQLRIIPDTAVESSQDAELDLLEASALAQPKAREVTTGWSPGQTRDSSAVLIQPHSSQRRGQNRSSSAIDIMGFFGGTPKRLSKEATAVSADLMAAAHSPGQHAKSSQTNSSQTETPRRTSRRPGEVRKILRVPEPHVPSAELQAASQSSVRRSPIEINESGPAVADPPKRITRASSRRSQSVVSEFAEGAGSKHQSHSPMQSPTMRRMSKSTIIESIETIETPTKSQILTSLPLTSPTMQTHVHEPVSTMMSVTYEERPTQSKVEHVLATPHAGLRTSYSYYVPLSGLSAYINKPTAYDSTVDVLAVVYRATSDAAKADKGRKDWFTKMRITQPNFWRNTTLVQVFRGYKSAVPNAEPGDVILLRSFLVTGNKRGGIALKSGDGSAWCVFKASAASGRFGEQAVRADQSNDEYGSDAEVMSGPPAEFGDQERKAATHLKEWWRQIKEEMDTKQRKDKSQL